MNREFAEALNREQSPTGLFFRPADPHPYYPPDRYWSEERRGRR